MDNHKRQIQKPLIVRGCHPTFTQDLNLLNDLRQLQRQRNHQDQVWGENFHHLLTFSISWAAAETLLVTNMCHSMLDTPATTTPQNKESCKPYWPLCMSTCCFSYHSYKVAHCTVPHP